MTTTVDLVVSLVLVVLFIALVPLILIAALLYGIFLGVSNVVDRS